MCASWDKNRFKVLRLNTSIILYTYTPKDYVIFTVHHDNKSQV
jgi:hypothetical protein